MAGPIAQTVNRANSSMMLISSLNPSTFGQSVTFTATVTPNSGTATPTGTVVFIDGATTLGTASLTSGQATFAISTLIGGNHSITASYSGDANFTGSIAGPIAQTVNRDGTSTTLTSSPNPSTGGQAVTFTAAVTATAPGSGIATGTVTFKTAKSTLGIVPLDRSGHATFTTSSLPAGSTRVFAVYSGDSNFLTSTGNTVQTVRAKTATTTSLVSSLNPSPFGQAVTFTATVTSTSGTPTGTVTFLDGKAPLGSSTLNSAGVATFTISSLAVGRHRITARYNGSSTFNSSTSAALTQTVNSATIAATLASQTLASQAAVENWFAPAAAHFGKPRDSIDLLHPVVLEGAQTLKMAVFIDRRMLKDTLDILFGEWSDTGSPLTQEENTPTRD
jgi:hypothetical protein